MISPFKGRFRITQTQHETHDGLDIVALDDPTVYSTIDGTVEKVGWESTLNHYKGFGYYVVLRTGDLYYFFGHLVKNSSPLKVGSRIRKGEIVGVMGNTGRSTGPHLHYCCRRDRSKAKVQNISTLSGIPNREGEYKPSTSGTTFLKPGTWNVRTGPSFDAAVARVVKGTQTVIYVDIVSGDGIKWYQLRDGNYISVNACV